MQSATDLHLSGTKVFAVRHEHQVDQLHVFYQHIFDEKINAMALAGSVICVHEQPCVKDVSLNRFIVQSGNTMITKPYEQHIEHA